MCGLTDPETARAVADCGVDWIGLNFHPPSPRYVSEPVAAAIVAALPPTAQAVGLFVNRIPAEVRNMARRVGLTVLQLHGDEPPEDFLEFGVEFFLVRAFRLADHAALLRMAAYLEQCERLGRPPDAVLADAYVSGQAGGTGRTLANDLLDHLPSLPRLILAGGLTPENVADRVRHVRPWMVDVASGVESTPGRKDLARVAAFVHAAHSA